MAEGEITSDEYMTKLDHFIVSRTNGVLGLNNQYQLRSCYDRAAAFYKKETSTGLGLTITKQLVEMHKGSIKVVSEKGKGAEFIVTLPIELVEEPLA